MPLVQVHNNGQLSTDELHSVIEKLPVIIAAHMGTNEDPLTPQEVSVWDQSSSNQSRPSHDVEVLIDFTSTSNRMKEFPRFSNTIKAEIKASLPPDVTCYVWFRPQHGAKFVDISTTEPLPRRERRPIETFER